MEILTRFKIIGVYNETEKHILPAYRGVDRQKCFHLPKAPLGFQWEDEKNHQLSLHHFMDLSFVFVFAVVVIFLSGRMVLCSRLSASAVVLMKKQQKQKNDWYFTSGGLFFEHVCRAHSDTGGENLCCFVKTFYILKKKNTGPACIK